jgi:spore germination protein YaaH
MSSDRRDGDGSRHLYRTRRRRAPARLAAVVALIAAVAIAVVAWTQFGRAANGPAAVASPSPTPARSAPAPGPTRSSAASPTATAAPRTPFAVAAWSRGDVPSLRAATAAHALTEVDLDWWHARPDGSLAPEAVAPAFVRRAHADGLRVFATVTNRASDDAAFDPAIAEAILATPATRARHVAALVALTRADGYDGIDVDWESLRTADRASFSAFVALLAARLHAAGKLLSIAVYDKTSDYPTGTEAGARGAEDYAALGRVVDEFKVLTFGEHGSFTGPGPLSSPAWTAGVLAYAESQVAPAKIYLGVPFYGFDWGSGPPRYLLWSGAQELLARSGATVLRSSSGEAYFRYAAGGVEHTVYFQDPAAVAAKLAFATSRRPRIAGIAIWVMGDEDPAFWTMIHAGLPRD